MVNRSPIIFDPLSPPSLSKLVYAAVRSDDMDLAVSLMDQMIMEMTLAYRQHQSLHHQHAHDDTSSLVQLSLQNMIQAAPANETLEGVLALFAKYQPYLGRSGYNAVLSAMARHGQGEQAEQLLDEMCKGYCVDWTGDTISPDIRSFNLVLSAWSQSRGPSGAERAHAILLRLYDPFDWGALGITPDEVSWNTVLKAWARSSRADAVSSAVHVLHEMKEYGRAGMNEARPTAVAYGTVLDAMAKKGQAEVAERLWLEMYHNWETDPEWGVAPTWMTAAPVLQAWSLSNRADRTHRAEQWLMRVKNLIPEDPDPAVYHLLLSCYGSQSTVESANQAEALLQSMSDPDFASYSILIQHLAKIPEKVTRAHELFQIVQERYRNGDASFRPDARSLDSILQSFCKADHAIATKVLQDVLEGASSGHCVSPSLKTFGSFMNSFKTSSNPASPVLAYNLVNAMQNLHRSGVLPQGPDHLIYQSLIVLWTRSDLKIKDASRTALGILKEFRSKALEGELEQGPTTIDYNLVIRSLTRDYHPVIAHELLEEMVSSRWAEQSRPDAATFHAVQWGWAKIGNENALQHMKVVFRYMDQLGFIHDTVSKNNVIHCLSRMGDLESAENVLKSMKASRDKRTRPSPVSYESVMMGWLKISNLDRAYEVLLAFDEECERGTYVPLERPYVTMRRSLEEAGDHERAESVTALWRRLQNHKH
jgi:pentatricopeptide repeat protein